MLKHEQEHLADKQEQTALLMTVEDQMSRSDSIRG